MDDPEKDEMAPAEGPSYIDMTPSPSATFGIYAYLLRDALTDRTIERRNKKLKYVKSEMERYSRIFEKAELSWPDIESALRMAAQKKGDVSHGD